MRKFACIVILVVMASFALERVYGANLLRSDWVGRELHLVDRDEGSL